MTVFSVRLRRIAAYTTTLTMAAFGFTSMASAQSITNTSPGSTNNITTNVTNNCTVTNTNTVNATSVNNQTATTGDANVGGSSVLPWSGWDKLAPEAAQQGGEGYAGWWGNVLDWVSARATGQGWSDPENQSGWTPASGEWGQWDPVAWQEQGHSFNDWFAGVQGYVNASSPTWLMTWPQNGGNTLGGDATTGDATNVNNASFTVNIINRAPVDSCGHSVIPVVPPVNPPSGGGSGGGSWVSPASYSAPKSGGSGSGGVSGYSSYAAPYYSAPKATYVAPAVVTPPSTPSTPVTPPVPPTPPTPPANTISNTGPGSSNNITSNNTNNSQVTNTNVVSTVSMNQQSASSGDANVSSNTSAGGAGSGGASNANGVGGDVSVTN